MGNTKISRPWCGKKDNLPSSMKKEHHKERKTLAQLLHHIEDKDWEQQLKDYIRNADQQI